jgi:uncharacterized membrane protein
MSALLGILLIAAGLNHFRRPDFYERMMPPGLPWPWELVILSGIAEVVIGGLLLWPGARRLGAWMAIALFVAVFPANVQMALRPERFPEFSPTLLWARLPLQGLLIGWAYRLTRPPRSARRSAG